ncbi:PREDICTED: kinase suppressor of Ras 1-like [Rhagoletis zephyria]|uniref:kinase suppressor of Ras 1-like n=1 Tax=Rhagoletis zephyria TaxID=28612 RepID=UPI0008117644|nr:PREDICTED: kinase suppressor of Ras 1-like [Rhagoletis zephyria]
MHTEGRQTVASSADSIMTSLHHVGHNNNNGDSSALVGSINGGGGGGSPTAVLGKGGGGAAVVNDDNSAKLNTAIEACRMIQSLIDISYNNMIGIRTQCDVSRPDIQKEIRTLENKVVRHIAQQILEKMKVPGYKGIKQLQAIPKLQQWLKLVGLDDSRIEFLTREFKTVDALMDASEEQQREAVLRAFAIDNVSSSDEDEGVEEDNGGDPCNGRCSSSNSNNVQMARDGRRYVRGHIKRLVQAQICLHTYVDALQNDVEPSTCFDLTWGSWNMAWNSDEKKAAAIISAAVSESANSTPYNFGFLSHRSSKSSSGKQHNSLDNLPHSAPHGRRRLATEPGSIGSTSPILSSDCSSPVAVSPDNFTASQLQAQQQYHLAHGGPDGGGGFAMPPHMSPLSSAAANNNCGQQQQQTNHSGGGGGGGNSSSSGDEQSRNDAPRSPRSQGMLHSIHHRFTATMKIIAMCSVCDRPMILGYKCRDCKYYCHNDCLHRAPNSCGLPKLFMEMFKEKANLEKQLQLTDSGTFCNSFTPSPNASSSRAASLSSASFSHSARTKSQLGSYNQMGCSIGGCPGHSSSNPSSPALFNNSNNSINNLCSGGQHQHSSSSSTGISPTNPPLPPLPQPYKYSSQFQFPPDINITFSNSGPASCMINSETDGDMGGGGSSDLNQVNDESDGGSIGGGMGIKCIDTIHEEEEGSGSCGGTGAKNSGGGSPNYLIDTDSSKGSTLATAGSGSSGDSGRTLTGRLDSQDSQASDILDGDGRIWPRQNSLMMREWDINFAELELGEVIGTGRFGTVYTGHWHGAVAIKCLNSGKNAYENQKVLETFRQEVAIFRKTRHDNLVLFMGACMRQPNLAIVISLCKGMTLHNHIHIRHDKFNLNRIILISQQICMGMGYLHARGIIHKDLKTKNIFYDNGKVTITDFGLSSIAKLCDTNQRVDRLTVPKGWLCYLAPEIIQSLSINSWDSDDLPFSYATDVYAYGTILYELMCGMWPFAGHPSEVIIWQVGRGIRQPLMNCQASREVKDLLNLCWAYDEDERPDFANGILSLIQKLPKKRLTRSPSHPTHLQHTSEQNF